MRINLTWFIGYLSLISCLPAGSLERFVPPSGTVGQAANFDSLRHTGLSCKVGELPTVEGKTRYALKHLEVDFGGGVLAEDFLIELEHQQQLESLFLVHLRIRHGDVGKVFKSAPSLTTLGLLSGSLAELDWPDSGPSLKKLWLFARDLTTIPNRLTDSDTIEFFRCTECSLKELTADFSKMHSLKNLSLSHCGIQHVAESFRLPPSLDFLELSFNQISSLPRAIQGVEKLRVVDLMGNRIEQIPNWLDDLWETLPVDINLADNRIRTVPDFIWEHKARINLAGNLFSDSAPDDIPKSK